MSEEKFKVHTTGRNTRQAMLDTCNLVVTMQKGAKIKWSKLKKALHKASKSAGILKD